MSIEAPQPGNDATAGAGITLTMQAVYLKDCSFEAPQGPRITGEWSPQIGLDINTAVSHITGDLHEVLLTVTVSAKQGEQTMFLAEVKQAGAFVMQNLTEPDFRRAVGVVCPGVLFPYARAVVSHLVSQGGFPQLLLPPVNFEMLFASSGGAGATSVAKN
jgi:preprotein translocase subunit SecB